MFKNAVKRAASSFSYAITINIVIACGILAVVRQPDFFPVLPEFAAHFATPVIGMLVQWLLIGLTSAAFGFWSVLLEKETWSMLKQCIIYFILTSMVWIPVSVICWGVGKYVQSFVSVILSYSISYIIIWIVQYRNCKQSIRQINQRLKELEQ